MAPAATEVAAALAAMPVARVRELLSDLTAEELGSLRRAMRRLATREAVERHQRRTFPQASARRR